MCVFWYPLSFRADKVSHVTWLEMMPSFQLVKPTCWGCQFQSLLIRERLAAVFKGTKRPEKINKMKVITFFLFLVCFSFIAIVFIVFCWQWENSAFFNFQICVEWLHSKAFGGPQQTPANVPLSEHHSLVGLHYHSLGVCSGRDSHTASSQPIAGPLSPLAHAIQPPFL